VGASQVSAAPIEETPPKQPWEQVVVSIERAKLNDEISIDEAAIYRYYALTDPSKVPVGWKN
jgi:hypothetical protein